MEMLGGDVTRMSVIVLPEEDEYVYCASYCFVQSNAARFCGALEIYKYSCGLVS